MLLWFVDFSSLTCVVALERSQMSMTEKQKEETQVRLQNVGNACEYILAVEVGKEGKKTKKYKKKKKKSNSKKKVGKQETLLPCSLRVHSTYGAETLTHSNTRKFSLSLSLPFHPKLLLQGHTLPFHILPNKSSLASSPWRKFTMCPSFVHKVRVINMALCMYVKLVLQNQWHNELNIQPHIETNNLYKTS